MFFIFATVTVTINYVYFSLLFILVLLKMLVFVITIIRHVNHDSKSKITSRSLFSRVDLGGILLWIRL
jgi:hypothetical protein